MSLSFTKPPKVPDTEEVEPEHIDKAWPPPPYGFVVTPPGYTRASQSPVPGASGARMPLPHPLQLSELRPTYNQYILADGTHMQRRSPAFSISLWTGEMLIFSTIASIAVNFTSAYLANSLQPPRVRRALALSASVRNVSKTAPRIAFMCKRREKKKKKKKKKNRQHSHTHSHLFTQ
jgi:hypothetical protein